MTLARLLHPLALAGGLLLFAAGELVQGQPAGDAPAIDGPDHAGVYAAVDFPPPLWMANIGSKIDGAGMCVDSSVTMAGRWQGVPGIDGKGGVPCFRDYWARAEPGGNYPAGLVRQIRAYWQKLGIPEPEYVQYEGPDPRPLLKLLSKTGRMACITYGQSERYRGPRNPTGRIAHMTCCPQFGGGWAVCLDNNAVGGVQPPDRLYEWMSEDELVRRIGYPSGSCWVFAWLAQAAPPPPWN